MRQVFSSMKRIISIITITVLSLIVLVFFVIQIYNGLNSCKEEVIKEQIVDFEELDLQVLLRVRPIGLGGNRIEVYAYPAMYPLPVKTETKIIEDTNNALIKLYNYEMYYRKQNDSTLVIYASSQSIPKDQKGGEIRFGKLNLILNILNHKEWEEYERNYEYGLKKIDLYEGQSWDYGNLLNYSSVALPQNVYKKNKNNLKKNK